MPRGDGTGPAGMGPRSGRAAGYCAGYSVPGYMNPVPGRGFSRGRGDGFGRGGGRGWRNWYYATGLPGWMRAGYGYPAYGAPAYPYAPEPTAEEESSMLKEQAEALKEELNDIQERIKTLEEARKQENK
ncbi:MAG: DUF5320 domain-containing protein [Candidatus Omnitrophota bacterium]